MDEMPIIVYPPFAPSFARYERAIRLDALAEVRSQAIALFEEASVRLTPAFTLRPRFIDTYDSSNLLPTIEIEGISFSGKALAALSGVHRVFPYIATCGNGMEDFALDAYDMLAPYWLDVLKNQALACARKAMLAYCKNHLGISKPLSVNPGSGNVDIWPVEQLSGIFALLGNANDIGVRLTPSSLMIPNKTVAGLLFSSAVSDFDSCAYCERSNCPDRRVPFRERL